MVTARDTGEAMEEEWVKRNTAARRNSTSTFIEICLKL
jgi:hypothetical protein